MTGAKRSTWIGGTVFVGVVIAVATWFLFVSPTLASAADVRSQADQTRQQNDLLTLKVTKLKADFTKLPEYKAQLAGLQKQIPLDADLSAYFLQINKIADAHSVVITSIAPDTPQTVKLAPAPKPATASSDSSTDGSSDSSTPSPSPTPTPSASAGASGTGSKTATVPDGFVAIPFSVTVLGKYADTVAFLHDVQRGTDRLFLVSGLTGTAQKDAAAVSGKPATHEGDQELEISGFTYVLNPELASVAVTAPTPAPTTKPALPKPPSSKNPLVPVGK
ncbi:hypothetical protein [Cellulomonas alba]|uniref:Pilus assembly protein PilO n=1 Tax=Cellulomonas alba TaxID=3053467 RepID=A0ABT7SB43_9CELL|nr:hypothetical protein [Cellulomonas alba]MDM7853403.1 hypothetical protein [Cellulomonas alba]